MIPVGRARARARERRLTAIRLGSYAVITLVLIAVCILAG